MRTISRIKDMKQKLVGFNDEVLHSVAQEVPFNNTEIPQDVIDSFEGEKMLGLSAPQIGIPYRCSVCHFSTGVEVIINPELELEGDTTIISTERCLSFPNIECKIKRHTKVKLTYFNKSWNKCEKILEGLDAIIAQHEYDHLDGITMINRAIYKTFKRR